MAMNNVLVDRVIDAKCFVVGDVGFNPLDAGSELDQDFIGFLCGGAKLIALETANFGNIAFDDEFMHGYSPVTRCFARNAIVKALLGICS